MQEPAYCGFNFLSGNEDAHDANGVICSPHGGQQKTLQAVYQQLTGSKSSPVGTRTQNRRLRRQMLYPVELRDHAS